MTGKSLKKMEDEQREYQQNKPNVQDQPIHESNGKSDLAAQQRASRRRNRGTVAKADWETANPAGICAAIAAVTHLGFAIRFGYTRDGGAFAIGVIGDGEPFTEFVRPSEDIDLYLASLVRDYGD